MLRSRLRDCVSLPFRLTAPWRRLPEFLLIGAQKSGTTSLFHYLMMHPSVATNPRQRKEVYFFNKDYSRGLEFYRQYFPLKSVKGLVGEGSTVYLHSPKAPERVASSLPDVKLLAVLREPAARAVSHYYHHVKRGRETRSINEAFSPDLIERWLAGDLEDGLSYRYLNNGHYGEHLQHWLEHFSPNQLLVLKAEDLFSDPQSVYNRVCGFLGLEEFNLSNVAVHNQGPRKTNSSENLEMLHSYYSDSVDRLTKLGVIDFSWEPYAKVR